MAKRLSLKETQEIVIWAGPRLQGYISRIEIEELYQLLRSGAAIDALLMAFDAGYHRGAIAAQSGKYDPVQARKKQLKRKQAND